MGFSTLLDILGSTLVGGLLLLILIRVTLSAIQNNYDNNGERIVQKDLTAVAQLLEYDFRKIGYCAKLSNMPASKDTVIKIATDSSITFYADLPTTANSYGDSVLDKVYYYLGPKSGLSNTPNPNDRVLYRVINNGTPMAVNMGVTLFKLTYYDQYGNAITPSGNAPYSPAIASVQIDLAISNPYGYYNPDNPTGTYSTAKTAYWRQIRLPMWNYQNR
jgi:hypothetical protein